jgi:chromosome segregation ATPase
MDAAKKARGAAGETKATAEGDLAVTSKDLAEDIKSLAELHHDCMTKANEFEEETKSRGEELHALAEAKKVISEATGGAEALSYSLSQLSLLQVSKSAVSSGGFQVVKFVRKLAEKQQSAALAQLASRMASVVQFGSANGEDVFAKVKGLIKEMIERLLAEAQADASHKAYCDKEMAETKEKKEDKEAEIAKLTTKIDKMSAESAKLKEEVAVLQKELAELAKMQAEMDKLRQEEHAAYSENRPEMEAGVEGIKLALKILREYYAKEDKSHEAAEGAGSSIIGLLEVAESDFTTGLSEMIAQEEAAAAEYDRQTKENAIEKATKDQDGKYKTQESKSLDSAVAELTSDRSGVQTELEAVLEYFSKLKEQCVAKAEPYEERVRRREAEIAGLKEALQILSGDAVLLQRDESRALRGASSQ